ncbi:unnamed protein product [Gordionus sp. m RMFG-2023]|uniref:integrator complex subunit 2-like n=1 Tax=Gordionus sp. m RMFG-2023 TaxID=3053472 RepID=UPI0030E53A7C
MLKNEGPSNEISSSIKELFLHMILFVNNQMNHLSEIVSKCLGIKVHIKPHAIVRIKHILNKITFDEKTLIYYGKTLSITKNLNSHSPGISPLICMIHLLKSKFSFCHKIIMQPWIHDQILNASIPLHPSFIVMIENFIYVILSNYKLTQVKCHLFNEHKILDMLGFKNLGPRFNLAPHLLMLYYLLFYEDMLIDPKSQYFSPPLALELNFISLINQIPIKHYIMYSIQNYKDYGNLPSILLSLIMNNHSYLCIINEWISQPLIYYYHPFKYGYDSCTLKTLTHYLMANDISSEWVSELAPALINITEFSLLNQMLCRLIEHLSPLALKLDIFCFTPYKLRLIEAFRSLITFNGTSFTFISNTLTSLMQSKTSELSMMKSHDFKQIYAKMTHLALDPLICLRGEPSYFENPLTLSLIIKTCEYSLSFSLNFYSKYLNGVQTEREDIVSNLTFVQECVVLQILIETLDFGRKTCLESLPLARSFNRKELETLVCCHLHQRFIDEPALVKEIHTQGYALALIPTLVANVPSIHICMDFVLDLVLKDPSLQAKIFGIHLAFNLSRYYALPKLMDICNVCVKAISTILETGNLNRYLSTDDRLRFLLQTLPPLVILCRSFPFFLEPCLKILVQLGKLVNIENVVNCHTFRLESNVDHINGKALNKYYDSNNMDADHAVDFDKMAKEIVATYVAIISEFNLI